jgi:hypothetical protein
MLEVLRRIANGDREDEPDEVESGGTCAARPSVRMSEANVRKVVDLLPTGAPKRKLALAAEYGMSLSTVKRQLRRPVARTAWFQHGRCATTALGPRYLAASPLAVRRPRVFRPLLLSHAAEDRSARTGQRLSANPDATKSIYRINARRHRWNFAYRVNNLFAG